MRYEEIDNKLFIKNRQKIAQKLGPGECAILCSNDVLRTNADGVWGFKQNTDLFYLSGIDQEDTFLFLFPEHPDKNLREVLFIRKTDEFLKIWEGEKLTKEQARKISGIEHVLFSDSFESSIKKWLVKADNVYLNTNEASISLDATAQIKLIQQLKGLFPLHTFKRLAPLLCELRMIKEPEEIALIEKAIKITKIGFLEALKKIKNLSFEFEVEAELTYHFLMNRSRGHAFLPIMAGGASANILHYVENNQRLNAGNLLLMDFGAEYANYNADITRTVPINGQFTKRQKEVYTAVLEILNFNRKNMVTGKSFDDLKTENYSFIFEKLRELNLGKSGDKKDTLVNKYMPHSVSHHLGLDVHDVSNKYTLFAPGMVLTCEPGIYIQEEGLGIRLEEDLLITSTENVNLSEQIPINIDDIEIMMH